LDDRRQAINDELKRFYAITDPGQKSIYLSSHPDFAIDKAEADAIRDVIYPRMDKFAGKPAGYFESLQRKRGAFGSVSKQASGRKEKLELAMKKIKGGSKDESVQTYGTSGGNIKFATNIGRMIKKPNPLGKANKQVSQAFHHAPGTKIRAALSSIPGVEGMALPLRESTLPGPVLSYPDEEEQQ
jgi:hypothetical protein